ncbi:MAG: prolipoprotein diacylglyceryl transferase [bacterium]
MHHYVHNLSPFLWQWGESGWGIRYYGLAYVLGFLFFYGGMVLFYRWKWSPLTPNQISDLLVWMMVGVLAGGRLSYCLIYDLPQTLRDPLSVISFWRGGISGMSSHGGILGAAAAMWLYARKTQTSFWTLADHTTILTTIGIFLGRIANFINGELWGRPATVPWAVIFPQAPLVNGQLAPRHPSQLYEALGEGLFLFGVLLFLRWKGWSNGKIAVTFLALYATVRIFLETFREPDAQMGFFFGNVTAGQLLSFAMLAVAAVLWIWRKRQKWG